MQNEPFSDVVVVIPGIMGSTLRLGDKLVWSPSAGSVLRALDVFRHHVEEVAVPPGTGDGPDPRVQPVAIMPDLHMLGGFWTVHLGYTALCTWLQQQFALTPVTDDGPPGNLLTFPYDWRLSNRYNGRELFKRVDPILDRWQKQRGPAADARLILVCHSMGGLVAQWFLQECGGTEMTRKLITLGTPYRGALEALEQLVNGVRKGPRPFRVDLTSFVRSLPSAYQLLPEYACIESPRGLMKTTETSLPTDVTSELVTDAMLFHQQLAAKPLALDSTYVLTGREQRTATTAQVRGDGIVAQYTIEGADEAGDGTVPTVGSVPSGVAPDSPSLFFVAEHHGALQSNHGVFDQLHGILTGRHEEHRGPGATRLDVSVPDVLDRGEDLHVSARILGDLEPIVATILDETGAEVDSQRMVTQDDEIGTTFAGLDPGGYTVRVHGAGPTAEATVDPVTSAVLIWDDV
jgi:pimeloyl-ACP methyl ester carboxylesterase